MTASLTQHVLDHGFVRLHNLAGPVRRGGEDDLFDADDTDPAHTARMSFHKMEADRTREDDLKLANYLMAHKHTTPFEMVTVWLEMKLPIFVARQFVRHRTVSINEVSARYVQLPAQWYIPEPEHVGLRPANLKQGRELQWAELTPEQQETIHEHCRRLNDNCSKAYADYHWAVEHGIPPEVARLQLHVNHYTHWIWKQDLHNLMHFLSLRVDSHAQWEAQQYGQAVYKLLKQHLPHSMELFDKHRRLSAD